MKMLNESQLQKGELKSIAKILLGMQEGKELGNGVPAVRNLAQLLKKGKVREAIAAARNIGDKIHDYPEIRRFIHDVIYPIGYLDLESGMLVNDKE
jgi:hypothetical protein